MSDKRFSHEHELYLKNIRRTKHLVNTCRIGVLIFFLLLWQLAADTGRIDSFITSSPLRVFASIASLIKDGTLFKHTLITLAETVCGFILGLSGGILIAMLLWWFPTLSRISDPYLVVLNAMPKVALGPIIIIWAGAATGSIIIMTLAISLITTIIGVYSGFVAVDEERITLLKTLGADKAQILFKVVLPASYENILSCMKINVGMSWVGVIMGEFLVSKAGLGYLIMYGSQVFNLDLVMAGIVVISLIASLMYITINAVEKAVRKKFEQL